MEFIRFVSIHFNCPYCNKQYNDEDDTLYKRIYNNKSCITYKKCTCGNKFYITYDFKGNLIAFK